MYRERKINVFLSASADVQLLPPDASAPLNAFPEAPDCAAVRDALLAFVQVLLPASHVYFGGHPTITRLLAHVLEEKGQTCLAEHFSLYQSKFFAQKFPPENNIFSSRMITTDIVGDGSSDRSRDMSLTKMREAMLDPEHSIELCIFMGGKEAGLAEELGIVQRNFPRALILPLAMTGGYSAKIYAACKPDDARGAEQGIIVPASLYHRCHRFRFYTLFQDVLNIIQHHDNE